MPTLASHPPLRSLAIVAWCAFCLLSLTTAPSTVFAQDDQERAEQLFGEGRDYFNDGNYLQAAQTFVEVERLLDTPPPQLYFNIGQAYLRAEELTKAEDYLQQYLNEATDPPNEDEVAEMIIDIQEERAARIATVDLTTYPAGAEIFIDGQSRCETPCSLDLEPGDYSLRATLEDHVDTTRDFALEPRDEAELTIAMEAKVFFGFLDVRTDVADAMLVVDGREYSLPHGDPLELETGSYTIDLRRGDDSVTHDIDIERDETLHLFVPIASVGDDGGFSSLRATSIGLGGASVALIIAATATGMQARSTHESLETQQSASGYVDADLVASGQRQQRATNYLWIGAASTLLAGAGLWTFDAMRDSSGDETLEPTEVQEEQESETATDDDPDVDAPD